MPCFLTVTIHLSDAALAGKAAGELGLVEGFDYFSYGSAIGFMDVAKANQVKQRYGVLEAEARARKKGYSTRRQVQDDGTITVTLRN